MKVGRKKFEAKSRWSSMTVFTNGVETPGEGVEMVARLDGEPNMAEEVGE